VCGLRPHSYENHLQLTSGVRQHSPLAIATVRFSRGFKVAYWLALIAMLSWFLSLRLADAIAGRATAADTLVFAIWIALLLAPLFAEVELLGIKLKQEVEKVKEEVKRDIASLKAEITSAIDVRTNISPTFYLTPPPDTQIPAIAQEVRRAVASEGVEPGAGSRGPTFHGLDPDTLFLIATRRNLEMELRRIAEGRELTVSDRPMSGAQLVRLLSQAEVIGPDLARAIRDVYSICSPAVHGEPVSQPKIDLVREVGSDLLAALSGIH
jgi:hypothetical protein